jgi:hypothetical protein
VERPRLRCRWRHAGRGDLSVGDICTW